VSWYPSGDKDEEEAAPLSSLESAMLNRPRLTRKQKEAAHRYGPDDRCICGGLAVYFEDDERPGHGCEVEGRPWARAVARLDPQVRRDEARAALEVSRNPARQMPAGPKHS
jgi:hypothetical protein